MGKHRKWVQIVIFAAVVIIGALTLGNNLFLADKKPVQGGKAPEFKLVGLDGKQHQLSDYKGKIVVVNFWGTFCEPCRNEMPALDRQYAKWKDKNVVVLGLNIGERPVSVRTFVEQYNVKFPILLDDNEEIRKRFGVRDYPTTFFINPDGRIARIQVGEMTESFIEQTITSLQ
ncbi:thiol-disulfide oxidoreductase ResA [Paenibacillus silviterrae]|uniref:thiol-disulfide oxidoreductase ResA n=1 Tax=Paenibacillus silviterrae TaxID=3242194 RepID=UPI0025436C6E|nr:thiol-disulfide oxidoreductase ResA [Paenibacillus chinjuensis]